MAPLRLKGLIFLAFVLIALPLAGCKDHNADVVGVWDWGTFAVHFDADKSWGATEKKRSTYEKMGGEWSTSGNKVTLTYSGSDSPSPAGSVFTISDDGITLEADTGAVGTMKKRLGGANLDVK